MTSRDFGSTLHESRNEFDSWRKEFQGLEIKKQTENPLASWTIGSHIKLPKLPIHLSSAPPSELFLTQQRLEILSEFFKSDIDFMSLSGPRGVGKSSIGYAAACIAFVNQMPLFYLPSAEVDWKAGGVAEFLNNFVSLNQFVEDKDIQSAISKIQQRAHDESGLLDLAVSALDDAKAIRIVDQIECAYTSEGRTLDPTIPDCVRYAIDQKGLGSFGQLLAVSSSYSNYEIRLHERWGPWIKTVLPPPKDEFLEMMRPLATEKLSKSPQVERNVLSVDEMVSEVIEEFGSPRHVADFLNQLPINPGVLSFFTSLRKYSDQLVSSMQFPISKVLDSLPHQTSKNRTIAMMCELALSTQTRKNTVSTGRLRDQGLAYEDGSTLRLLGRAAKRAFFLFLRSRDLLPEQEPITIETHLIDSITHKGFVTDSVAKTKLAVELPFKLGVSTLDQKLSSISHWTLLAVPQHQTSLGLDFFVTDPENKVVYAVQVSANSFLVDQRLKFESGSSLLQLLTGVCSPSSEEAEQGKNYLAKKVICKLLDLSQDSTKFTLDETASRIKIETGGKKDEVVLSPWHVIPVFMTESPRSANETMPIGETASSTGEPASEATTPLEQFFKHVRLFAGEDLKNFYDWNG